MTILDSAVRTFASIDPSTEYVEEWPDAPGFATVMGRVSQVIPAEDVDRYALPEAMTEYVDDRPVGVLTLNTEPTPIPIPEAVPFLGRLGTRYTTAGVAYNCERVPEEETVIEADVEPVVETVERGGEVLEEDVLYFEVHAWRTVETARGGDGS